MTQPTAPSDVQEDCAGYRAVLRLALPLILSNSFWTLQIFIDRVLLARYSSDALAASLPVAMVFWTILTLFQSTAAYATTFVAQYFGAGRMDRTGPSVWQAIYFAVGSGLLFLLLAPLAPWIVSLGGHDEALQQLEVEYFIPLAWSALPTLIVAAVTGFFNGRGESWTVLWINGAGLLANAVLDYLWIFGHGGFEPMGIAGAGWATVAGMWLSAFLAMALMLKRRYRETCATLSGWHFDRELFGRLMWFGLPSGLQWFLDGMAFTIFSVILGQMGREALAASSVTITFNLLAILPAVGVGQAVSVLVGQRLGENRPELAERATWNGLHLAWLYMTFVALLFVLIPETLLHVFANTENTAEWNAVQELVPVLLRFVAVYCLFDSVNLVFSFALKGAGDTRFVTVVALVLSWPIMVLPTMFAQWMGWGVLPAWGFASAYVIVLAIVFWFRFRTGLWKSMRVIETAADNMGAVVAADPASADDAVFQPVPGEAIVKSECDPV